MMSEEPALTLPRALQSPLDALATAGSSLAMAVGVAYDQKQPIKYGSASQFALLEASVSQFGLVVRECLRELETSLFQHQSRGPGVVGVGDMAHLTAAVDTEWQRIAEQLRLATEVFRSCIGARLPEHGCDRHERDFMLEGTRGLVLAVANAVDLIDRASTAAIGGLADEVDRRVYDLQATSPSDISTLVTGARAVSAAVQQLASAAAGRAEACDGRGMSDPGIKRSGDALRKVLPLLISSLRVSIVHPDQDGVVLATEYAYGQIVAATASLRSALQRRVKRPSDFKRADVATAALACVSLPANAPTETRQRRLEAFREACDTLADRGILERYRDVAVLGEIAACTQPARAGETPSTTCHRVCVTIGRAVSKHATAMVNDLHVRLSGTSIQPTIPASTDGPDPFDDVRPQMHDILERAQLLEDLVAIVDGTSADAVTPALRAQIQEALQADLPQTLVASLLVFWLEILRVRFSQTVL